MNTPYRIIFHIDLNAFFASCEMSANPALKNVPLGVGGTQGRGILTTANYIARSFGVKSAMNVFEAKRLCPDLVVVPVNFDLYKEKSHAFFTYLEQYTHQIEPASIDEGYLDMTDYLKTNDPIQTAKKIQNDLKTLYDLPCSIGIAPNRFLAKMASDYKKPEGITVFRKRDIQNNLWQLPIESMHGIGKKTVPNLKLIGIHTIKDLAQFKDLSLLSRFLGNSAESFYNKAWGDDDSIVDASKKDVYQSIGQSKTYDPLILTIQEGLNQLELLVRKVHLRLTDADLRTKSIAVSLRTPDFKTHSKHFSFPYHTDDLVVLLEESERLFELLYDSKPIALISVSASQLEKNDRLVTQIDLFDVSQYPSKKEALEDTLNKINAHYQKNILVQGDSSEKKPSE